MTWRKLFGFVMIALLGSVLFGCNGGQTEMPASKPPASSPSAEKHKASASPSPVATATPVSVVRGDGMATDLAPVLGGPISLEKSIIWSDTIARVRLSSVTGGVEGPDSGGWYDATFEFSLQVLEYLKGSGANEVTAVAKGGYQILFGSEASARAELPILLASRDSRWDNGEAIVFLYGAAYDEADRYRLGYMKWGPNEDGYSVASPHYRQWLPAAPSATISGQSGQRFLLSAPPFDPSISGQTSESLMGEPTIELGEMKALITRIDNEIAAGDGSVLYQHCLESKYEVPRVLRWRQAQGVLVTRADYAINSGLPTGTAIWAKPYGVGLEPDSYGRHWLEGPHKDFFAIETFNRREGNWSGGLPGDWFNYDVKVTTARPLPAGEFQYFVNGITADRLLCNAFNEIERNTHSDHVTITAPDGTVHETFYEPVSRTNGVGLGRIIGNFDVDGTSTSISLLIWRNVGLVVLRLTPHADLSGHLLQFIDLDGTVPILLVTDEATVDSSSGKYTWQVPDQPWESGDRFLLRIREAPPPATAPGLTPETILPGIGAVFTWQALEHINYQPVASYSIEYAQTLDGPWTPLGNPGQARQCSARMTGTECLLGYAIAGIQLGETLHFRLVAHSASYSSLPGPSVEFTAR